MDGVVQPVGQMAQSLSRVSTQAALPSIKALTVNMGLGWPCSSTAKDTLSGGDQACGLS